MHNWAQYQSVVRCCTWLSLFVGIVATSYGQSPAINTNANHPRPTITVHHHGGWQPSPRTLTSSASKVERSSYYPQLEGQMPSLPSFPGGLPAQQPADLPNGSGALVSSLSDLPLNSMSRQPDQTNNLPYDSYDSRGGLSGQPTSQINSPYANDLRGNNRNMVSSGLDNRMSGSGIQGAEVNPPRRPVPVSPAAFQSGQNSIMPPPQQYQQSQQYLPQQPVAGSTQLRQAREITTGLPYVTQAPAQRYPTSPYMGRPMYMTAAYQRTATVNYPNQMPNNSGAVLPQNLQPNPQPIFTNNTPGVYPTAYPQQCAPTLPPDGAMGAYVPPTVTPNWNPNMYSPNNSGYRPLLSLGQENYNVVLGRGILGQPTAYVPGQYLRNFLRYIFP